MTLTHEQIANLQIAARPLVEWLRENGHPHMKAIVDAESVEVTEALARTIFATPREEQGVPEPKDLVPTVTIVQEAHLRDISKQTLYRSEVVIVVSPEKRTWKVQKDSCTLATDRQGPMHQLRELVDEIYTRETSAMWPFKPCPVPRHVTATINILCPES